MIYATKRSFNADTYTPVQLYLQIRHHFRNCCLLESNDYKSRQDSRSFIGFDPILEIQLIDNEIQIREGENLQSVPVSTEQTLTQQIQELLQHYSFQEEGSNGFFGRVSFEFSHRDETRIDSTQSKPEIPILHLFVFRHVLLIDHFTNEGSLLENSLDGTFSGLQIEDLLKLQSPADLPFETIGNEMAAMSDDRFQTAVEKGIAHCERGDVFQLVLSNGFQQPYFGDDFAVYRQLRRTNPSPYLFYFDFETYRLFGSSPEAQMVIKKDRAEIHPIAGTVPRTGDLGIDLERLEFLRSDEKENAEHTMLVDLARNDLSRNCSDVKIEAYKEVQHFSHVTHLVSKVTGELRTNQAFSTFSQSFPAGTLSGTPKPRALELIHKYEERPRTFYGGSIGMFQPKGDMNMAIVIRSILSKENRLSYQAGAGIVLDSIPEKEVQEVHHKLRAVRTAIRNAHEFQSQPKNNLAL